MTEPTNDGPWAVYDANEDPPRRVGVAGSRDAAEHVRELYVRTAPAPINASWVYVATVDL